MHQGPRARGSARGPARLCTVVSIRRRDPEFSPRPPPHAARCEGAGERAELVLACRAPRSTLSFPHLPCLPSSSPRDKVAHSDRA